jgi:subtilase family serine protease
MTRRPLPVAAALTVLAAGLAVVPLTSSASAAPKLVDKRVCSVPVAGFAACHAHVRAVARPDGSLKPHATTTRTSGYIWSDLKSAYNLPTSTTTATVAVVDAFAHPNAAADLAAYRQQTGLPVLRAGQFQQFNQSGGAIGTVPADVGWGQEEMLDLEMVSAVCPSCNIIYVGGNSASFNDLAAAVNTAVDKGATVVSNSYGAPEFSGEGTFASAYDHPGVAITVSSGDSGYGVQAPAAFNTVVAVGGTNLKKTTTGTRGWAETAWTGAGSGCSALIPQQTWQAGRSSCSRRTVADVSAVADPNTGVAVYDSYGSTGNANWYVFGGTSVAAPIVGAVYALSGNTAGYPAQLAYTTSGGLWDVVSGSNAKGKCRFGNLCSATNGYDGPTGMGTPKGVTAF